MGCHLRCICTGRERHRPHFLPAGAIFALLNTSVFIDGNASFVDNMALGYGGKPPKMCFLMQGMDVTRIKLERPGIHLFVLCRTPKRRQP